MKKIGICFLFVMLAGAVFAWAGQQGAEKISMEGGRLGNVTLPHWQHQATLKDDCASCHNLFPQKANAVEEMKEKGKLKKKQVMNQCIACHKARKDASQAAGPVSCRACHVK